MKKKCIKILLALCVAVISFMVFNAQATYANDGCVISSDAVKHSADSFLKTMKDCSSGTSGVTIEDMTTTSSVSSLTKQIRILASGFMRYAALFAVAAIVIAGIMYTTAYGDDAKLKRAKNIGIFAVLGLVIALASYPLVNAVIYIIYGTIE